MAIIYRCDRCGADRMSRSELVHVEISSDDHEIEDQRRLLNRNDVRLPYRADLCRDCVITLLLAARPETRKP